MQDAQEFGVGSITSSEVDYDLRVTEAERQIDAPSNSLRTVGARAVDDRRSRALLTDLDHRRTSTRRTSSRNARNVTR